jgi:3-hydroxyacyl-CoA dehydrogenase/enoyl-CoA hydratase/3-hydroxybutyryl-CoA epimerase/3-hydroxyacyl-CoA dehydrogenase/enoyl-CoA hydratase/3-hydroxybutyryl-CoA epimerase/enoyl-CoA isomerase
MPLVEVIRGQGTSDDTIARAVAFARQLVKSPIVVGDGPGFLVNRLLLPYMNEALLLASEGVPLEAIDRAAKEFGMPMGPIELHEVVGLDVCLHAGRVMREAFADRMVDTPLLEALVDAGRLGQKNNKGFFDWQDKRGKLKRKPSSEVAKLLEKTTTAPATVEYNLADRLILPMLLEATRALDDGIVFGPHDLDLALILGIGFPPFRGGLLFWADQLGADAVASRLQKLVALGKRFEPTPIIQNMQKSNSRFYQQT